MKAIKKQLNSLIIELQTLECLNSFALAGWTNLALRFNHRISDDIDLFSNENIGISSMNLIKKQLSYFYKKNLKFCEIINAELPSQFCFLRAFIETENETIKVEILQNIQRIDDVELFDGIKMLTLTDIGLLKLVSACNRRAKKDIYDLDFITDKIKLSTLFDSLAIKSQKFYAKEFKCLFDLDNEPSPMENILLLLNFDNIDYSNLPSRPSHSNDRIEIISNSKSWISAKTSWRLKVIELMRLNGIPYPKIRPIN